MEIRESSRLKSLPTYVFATLEQMKAEARAKGLDLIDLGMGNPDLPTPAPVVEAAVEALKKPENFRYPTFEGKPTFRKAVADWYQRRYNITLDPDKEVLPLIGSKEGIAHLALAFIDTDDISLTPNPGYPVHSRGTLLAGGKIYPLPLTPENNYLPDIDSIPADVLNKTKLFFFSYPSNPTTAVADRAFFEKMVAFAQKHNIILCHDLAYAELAFDGYKPTSLLEIPGARELGVEFHTMSKTFNMAGWRVGFAVGNAKIIKALYNIKSNMDYGLFPVVQDAATAALNLPQSYVDEIIAHYKSRRNVLVDGLNSLGWKLEKPKATMYVWVPVPKGMTSAGFVETLIKETGVIVTPGNAFGSMGEGFVRISLIADEARLKEVVGRMKDKNLAFEG